MQRIEDVNIATAIDESKLRENIFATQKLGLPSYSVLRNPFNIERPVAIVGGGPTLAKTKELLKNYQDIILCGSVHDYMVEFIDTWPQVHINLYAAICDADDIMQSYVQKRRQEIRYLLASQCNPALFEWLCICDVYVWHSQSGEEFNKTLNIDEKELVTGGCTVGTRAMALAIKMGYKKLHLFGIDSCLTNEYEHHAYRFNNPDYETLGPIQDIKIGGPDSPTFKVAGYMLAQLLDFQRMLGTFPQDMEIEVFGQGAIKYLIDMAHQQMLDLKEKRNGTSI